MRPHFARISEKRVRHGIIMALSWGMLGGCHLFPEQEVDVWMKDLEPPENSSMNREELTETIRTESGVREFAFSKDLYTADPTIPNFLVPLFRLMMGK